MPIDKYGYKLRRWLTNVMILIVCSVISFMLAMHNVASFISDPGYKLLKLSGGLVVYLTGIHHLAWWHLFDLFDGESAYSSRYRWLVSYTAFLLAYAARPTAVGLGASGVWDSSVPCGGIFLVLVQSCVGPPISLSLTISAFSMAAYMFCLAKTVACIRSRKSR